jgi:hypothetical protein
MAMTWLDSLQNRVSMTIRQPDSRMNVVFTFELHCTLEIVSDHELCFHLLLEVSILGQEAHFGFITRKVPSGA